MRWALQGYSKPLYSRSKRVLIEVQESDGIISLPDDDPAVVRQMLKYLYTADYEDDTSFVPGDTPEPVPALLFTVHVHTIANKVSPNPS